MTESPFKRVTMRDRRVAIVGKLGSMNCREAKELLQQAGGNWLERPDASADLIVIGAEELLLDEHEDLLNELIDQGAPSNGLEIISEAQFCESLGLIEPPASLGQLYTPAMLADLLKLPLATIRRWHRLGLIRPTRQIKRLPYFDFQEIASARRIAKMIALGASPQRIEAKLTRLAGLYPDLQRPLAQLSIIVEGQDLLLRQEAGLIEPSGQRWLNFEAAEPPKIDSISLPILDPFGDHVSEPSDDHDPLSAHRFHDFTTPDEFIELAIDLEDRLEIESAIEVYRASLIAFGPAADICFRLGELMYQQGDLAGARERYYMTIELDDTYVEARASLGCVLVELNQLELAYGAFKGALVQHADYPDVHFHLARLLDQLDRLLEAEFHWKHFLKLAPQSPWADEARQRLEH